MNIVKVSVTWGETQSLPEYCNVKPSITLEAELGKDDNPGETLALLLVKAQAIVREMVDDSLETARLPAKYSTDPRYKAFESPRRKCIVIVPQALSVVETLEKDFTSTFAIPDNLRLEHLRRMIAHHRPNMAVIDCSDCDLARIPPLPEKQAELEDSSAEDEWNNWRKTMMPNEFYALEKKISTEIFNGLLPLCDPLVSGTHLANDIQPPKSIVSLAAKAAAAVFMAFERGYQMDVEQSWKEPEAFCAQDQEG